MAARVTRRKRRRRAVAAEAEEITGIVGGIVDDDGGVSQVVMALRKRYLPVSLTLMVDYALRFV